MVSKRGEVRSMVRRPFIIRVGLRQGFRDGGPMYHLDHAADVVLRWNQQRAAVGLFYLPCTVSEGRLVYAWGSGQQANAGIEPIVTIEGEVSSYLADVPDSAIEAMLDDLGDRLRTELKQERVEVVYCDRVWPLLPVPEKVSS